jgi:fructoselysine-6-P-deglycase FrlB-like protein
VLLLGPEASLNPPLLVVVSESGARPEWLSAAAQIAKACGDGLVALTIAATMENAQRLQKKAETVLRNVGVEAAIS